MTDITNMTERKDSTNNTGADVEKHETVVDVGKHETVGGHDGDEAMAAFQDGQAVDVDEDTNRRLLRKIYRYILPIICAVYCMNYLDETSLSYANIMGLNEDIHLRLPIAKYSGFCVIYWAMTLALFAISETGRVLAVARVRVNQQGIGNKHFKTYQFKEALMEPLALVFAFYSIASNIPNGGISNFFKRLVWLQSHAILLLGTPAGAVQVANLLLSGWYGDKYTNRLLVSLGGLSLAVLGAILLIALPDAAKADKLVGCYMTLAVTTPFVALLSLISSNIAGHTKKTTGATMYLIFYCAGNIIGPQTFRPVDAPGFIPAKVTILVCYVLCVVDVVFVWWNCRRMNQKKAALRAEPEYVALENSEWLDLTDKENPEFTYTL
ncbi:hypothetical protein GGI42DRAFT_348284 [Trichoderma sp. SZMC 28013]